MTFTYTEYMYFRLLLEFTLLVMVKCLMLLGHSRQKKKRSNVNACPKCALNLILK